ncbi:MAG TPA: monovalent cation/H+ antiporter subunit A [Burkholderiaceae bacterium]|nr:monovalent cation/H+ antiporter subunit A [Burkholderiaceae bacterium]
MNLLLLAALPFVGAAALAPIREQQRRAATLITAAAVVLGLVLTLLAAPGIFAGQIPRWHMDWVSAIGLTLGLRLDGLAWLFVLLIYAIGALVVLYAAYYLDAEDPAVRFFQQLLLFMGAMLGVVLADNLLLLVVFWEATSLTSFLLIGFRHVRPEARQGARMALTVTAAGGLALLGGVVLIGRVVGSFQLDAVLAAGPLLRESPLYLPALVLVLLGVFTKSAQFPFHFWLPQAMAAPTPVSAYLHSATMVKAGVFLLARLYPALGHSEPWFWIVSVIGLTTLLVGAYLAIFQQDLKGLLAYSTISHLGLITLLFGLDESLAVIAGVFHIVNHATFKASLFMAAGIIDHETGTRDMRRLNGLARYMPWTAALAIIASAAMAGVPLLNGFLSKEMFFGIAVAKHAPGIMEVALPLGAVVAGVFSVAYSARFIHDVFFNGEPVGLERVPHEPPPLMRLPVEVLVFVCLAVGIVPALTVGPTLASAAAASLQAPLPEYSLALWHGVNLPLLMSVVALLGGAALYAGLQYFINLHRVARLPYGGAEAFGFLITQTLAAARGVTTWVENAGLQRYLSVLVLVALLAGGLPFVGADLALPASGPLRQGLALLLLAGAVFALAATLAFRQRLVALLLIGAVGLVVSWAFVLLSAPDLALTQLLVEMVTIVLMMLALHGLPQDSPTERSAPRRTAHIALAAAAGLGTAALLYLTLTQPFDSISPYYLANAVPLGGGANAVNVILVDFRGFDTLGEITVLAVAALTVAALLRSSVGDVAPAPAPDLPATDDHPLSLRLAAGALLPFVILVAAFVFLRGHNAPGGGFIAALIFALGLILQYVAHGQRWTEARLPLNFSRWTATGLLIAGVTGLASGILGSPFLTSTYAHIDLPLLGDVPLASAAAFDLGVFLTVAGAAMILLTAIGRAAPEGR